MVKRTKAKAKAKELIHEKYKDQYLKLFSYSEQFKITTIVLKKVKDKKCIIRFKRLHVCLDSVNEW